MNADAQPLTLREAGVIPLTCFSQRWGLWLALVLGRFHTCTQTGRRLTRRVWNWPLQVIAGDPAAKARVFKSYQLFMDFAGYTVADMATGQVERKADFDGRVANINTRGHNFLRITRVVTRYSCHTCLNPSRAVPFRAAYSTGAVATLACDAS